MRFIYIANARMPTEKAHGIQIMKTCEAFVRAGVALELWLPRRRNSALLRGQDIFEFYQIPVRFPVRWIRSLDPIGWLNFLPGVGYRIQSATFGWGLSRQLRAFNDSDAVFYTRDLTVLPILKQAGVKYFYEAHTLPDSLSGTALQTLAASRGIVTITRQLSESLRQQVKDAAVLTAEDGVDLETFDHIFDRAQARAKLGFPKDKKIIMYTGHLYEWKGAHTLARASEFLPQAVEVYLVGGMRSDAAEFQRFLRKSGLTRVRLIGHVPHRLIPLYLASADILVLPNSGKEEISRAHTSPLKLFEYMASRRPIVASDLPSIREILDDTLAIFFAPDNAADLSEKIKSLLADLHLGERLADGARMHVSKYTWDARAKKIITFIGSRTSI